MSVTLFPTVQWLEAYRDALNESVAFDDIGAGWGVDFNGDVCIAITDLPLAETTLAALPEPVLAEIADPVCEQLADVSLAEAPELFDGRARESLPETASDLLDQLDDYVVDGNIYAYVGLEAGRCTEVDLLTGPDQRAVGTVIQGSCATWQGIVEGRPVVSTLLSGDLTVRSDRWRGLQHPMVLQELGEVAADFETAHLFPEPTTTLDEFVLDQSVGHSAAAQKLAYRQVRQVTNLFL